MQKNARRKLWDNLNQSGDSERVSLKKSHFNEVLKVRDENFTQWEQYMQDSELSARNSFVRMLCDRM